MTDRPRIVSETSATVVRVENDTAFLKPNSDPLVWQSRNGSLARRLTLTIPQDGVSPSVPNPYAYLAELAVEAMRADGKRAVVIQVTRVKLEKGIVY